MSSAKDRLWRNDHAAFVHNNKLYVWGGYMIVAKEDVVLPGDEIWLCDLDSTNWEVREITGDQPDELTGFCGSYANGTFYVFGGCSGPDYSNDMFSLDLREKPYTWRKADTEGPKPSPRSKHSCWVHGHRLIYFGGYGWKSLAEMQRTTSSTFVIEDMSWATIENAMIRFWGWDNEVSVFDTRTETWSIPNTQGVAPTPRSSHASAVLGNTGYICGGGEDNILDMFCLDLETWTWTTLKASSSFLPVGRSMFTMTPLPDHRLFVFGGLSITGETCKDAWYFDTQEKTWTEIKQEDMAKPRACHTACVGNDGDVVVFGGCRQIDIISDSIAILRVPTQRCCKAMAFFQTQTYSLSRLCNDFIGSNPGLFRKQLNWLPTKLRSKIEKRMVFFSPWSGNRINTQC